MRYFLVVLFVVNAVISFSSLAKPAAEYFAKGTEFDPSIPTPESVLGYEVGQWHVRHDQLVQYLHVIAQTSPRVHLERIGSSHQQRPLLLLSISSPERVANIDEVRAKHVASIKSESTAEQPAVVWMGYSVHGNEPSGSNAALLVAYYLAAAQGEAVESLLDNTVILLDPAMNPDGLARFTTWVNSNRGVTLSSDPQHREHVEAWPSSRTNHYLFDLNRDWLLLQHPESQARVRTFHQWQPHVLTDFHEMGPNSTYFFQPGIPSRTNPLTPKRNVELTALLAQSHAKALDAKKELYFTEESFDDFYIGKGSTYPDINGTVGILFEQASSRGHIQGTINGPLTFTKTIQNQVTTSLSTFSGVLENKSALLDYKKQFYLDAQKQAEKEKFSGYVVSKGTDPQRFSEFMRVLGQHQIKGYELTKALKTGGQSFVKGDIYIPLKQAQFRLIKAIFTEEKRFEDNTFYDVSGWTLAHAYNLEFASVKSRWGLSTQKAQWQHAKAELTELPDSYAYAFHWQPSASAPLLNSLLTQGVDARVAMKPFTASTSQGEQAFAAGSIVIASGVQKRDDLKLLLEKAQAQFTVPIYAITSGLTSKGVDLGSRQLRPLKAPKVLLIGGQGISQYEVGEVWHHLDTRLGIAPSIIEHDRLGRVELANYTHIIMVNGNYRQLSEKQQVAITAWVNKGGVIWGHKRGAKWLMDSQLLSAQSVTSQEMADQFTTEGLQYADREMLAGKRRIAGAIFDSRVDLSHPLSFGLPRSQLPVFKNSTWLLEPTEAPFLTVSRYAQSPLLAGYTADENIAKISGAAGMVAHRYGKGSVIAMTDNPVFRGFWAGSSRLLTNALFFGHTLAVQGR